MTQAVTNLDEHVRESLRSKIITGEITGGYHLSELKISKEYNVSRTPVREALCALAADGLIEMVPHRGAFVADVPVDIRADQIQTYMLFMSLVARQTSENGNIELLLDLETAGQSLADAASQDNETFMDALGNMNTMLRLSANSPTLDEALTMVERRTATDRIWQRAVSYKQELAGHYTKLVKAIKQHNTNDAEQTMRQIMVLLVEPILATMKD